MAKILIVDDAALMRMQLRDILTKLGHDIIAEAENGAQAVERNKMLEPDLITMDITMPEMNGTEAVKAIRETGSDVKIIMCSVMGQQSMVLDAIKAGAQDFIVKPFTPDRIKESLEKLF